MAVRLDVATDRISLLTSIPDPTTGITIAGWAYVSVDTNTNATLVRLHASSGGATTVTFATDADGLGGPGYFTGGGSVVSSTNMAVGAWRKVAITCTGTTGTLYVAPPGGATEVDGGTVGGAASPTGLTFGARAHNDGSEFLNGRLAYWRFWTSVLSQAQVEAEWLSTTPVVTANLWADWPLATADDLTDHSGNGRDLTAGSTVVTTEDGPPLTNDVTGTAVAALGGPTTIATGQVNVPGVAVASLGIITTLANGLRTVAASAVAALGTIHVTVVRSDELPATRLRASGREPANQVSGREPRSAL